MSIRSGVLFDALECFRRAEELMQRAVNSASEGDIIDAAVSVKMAKMSASSGGAVARVSRQVEDSLIDILA
jgi:hypothetical protein